MTIDRQHQVEMARETIDLLVALKDKWTADDASEEHKEMAKWKYNYVMIEAVVWYWKNIRWCEEGRGIRRGEQRVSWVEIALYFQAATHMEVARVGREGATETLEQKGKAMSNMIRNFSIMFDEDVVPGGRGGDGR